MAKKRVKVMIGGKPMEVSNLEKVLYPEAGFTKGEMLDYYIRIAPALLPHLKNRPLTMKRYPDGVDGFFFFEKNCPAHRPSWMKTTMVHSEKTDTNFCLANDLPSLVWIANLAGIELHTSLAVAKNVDRPAFLAFDLDPGPPANIIQCCRVGLWTREILSGMGLESYPKTSGSKGLQLYVPLNKPVTYDETKTFARTMAETLERQHPELVVSKMSKALRNGKVFVDWSQNDRHKTTICVYSLRARPQPTVSTPVTWAEVEAALKKGDPQKLVFTAADVLKRVEKLGDLFGPVLTEKQALPEFSPVS